MNRQEIGVLGRNFSARLKELRGHRSQDLFSKSLGINHQQTYQRYEAGKIPSGEILHQIAVNAGTTVDWLLGEGTTPTAKSLNTEALGRRLDDSQLEGIRELSDQQLEDFTARNLEQLKGCEAGFESLFLDIAARLVWEKIERVLGQNPNIDRTRACKALIHFFEEMASRGELQDGRES